MTRCDRLDAHELLKGIGKEGNDDDLRCLETVLFAPL